MTENIVNNNTKHNKSHSACLLPDFCDIRNLFIVILLTEVLAMVFAMAASNSTTAFWDYLAMASLLMLWIALLNSAVLCRLRGWLHQQSPRRCLVTAFTLMMLVSLLVAFSAIELSHYLLFDYSNTGAAHLFLLRVMSISAVVYFLLLRYFYVQQQWRLNLAAQSRAQIQALRARIRPHFLFNSMNTIASLIELAPEKAEQAVEDLSDLFRASLSEQNMNSLNDEIRLARSYLGIEALRLGERLQIEWQIDPDLLDNEVPALCIQPLTENAIYHGIEPIPEGGKILISALQIDHKLNLSVSNPIRSESQSSAVRKGNQMAQDNIRQRLQLVYGNQAEFKINDTKDNYTVSLIIPLDVKHERFDR